MISSRRRCCYCHSFRNRVLVAAAEGKQKGGESTTKMIFTRILNSSTIVLFLPTIDMKANRNKFSNTELKLN